MRAATRAQSRATHGRLRTRRHSRRIIAAGVIAVVAGLAAVLGALATAASSAGPISAVDLSKYVRIGRFDLPEPTRTPAPANSLLAQEVSAVTYNRDTDTLFVIGDGGTSVVQVSKTGALIDSMTLPPGTSPQGTEFYDTEGLAYSGGGQFVLTEERYRQVVRFTYVAGGTLTRAATQTVKLGTTIGNVGLEGVGNDPVSGGLILVKEKTPQSIFQTGVNWAAGTATNGSPTTVASVDLFDPSLIGTTDLSDVFPLANVSTLTGPDANDLLVISQESGKIVKVSRTGVVSGSITIQADPGNPLSVPDQTFEGVTMDDDGTIYAVTEAGGGDTNQPQLWVYKPTDAPNLAPTGVVLGNVVSSIAENTSTLGGIKVADITVFDDGLGANTLSVSGADAASFQISGGSLFVKPGVVLDFETKSSYSVTVNVDDPTVGATPDASTAYTLTVTDVLNETAAAGTVVVSEVAPWSSSSSPVLADWFEITNLGGTTVDITGWKMDDNSYSAGSAVALRGVTSLAPGASAIFLESGAAAGPADATLVARFNQTWFGSSTPPTGVQVGTYGGAGVGLSTAGDAVALFNAAASRVTGVSFGASSAGAPFRTFDNTAGLGGLGNPAPAVSLLSAVAVNQAFQRTNNNAGGTPVTEIGSPGRDYLPPVLTNTPFNITAEAAGATTPVPFAPPTATDLVDGSRPVVCAPASPGAFAIGTTPVTCSAADTSGNSASTTFQVTVRDTSPPTVLVPAPITVEATGPLTAVPFGPVLTTDAVDGTLPATCSPASPGPFAVGTTHVDCFRTDSRGNRGAALFNVTVTDTTPPVVTVPSDLTVDATSAAGALVSFASSSADLVDGPSAPVCAPLASGAMFPLGTTTVTCSVTDAADNTGSASFSVTVSAVRLTTVPPAVSTSQSAPFAWSSLFFQRTTCSLDGALFAACSSPRTYRGLAAGPHTFCVLATVDVQPTCRAWTIVSPGKPVPAILGVSIVGNTATVSFTSDQAASAPRYTCSLDGAAYRSCSSPLTYRGLALGAHTVRVLATNFAGDTSAAPASASFSIG